MFTISVVNYHYLLWIFHIFTRRLHISVLNFSKPTKNVLVSCLLYTTTNLVLYSNSPLNLVYEAENNQKNISVSILSIMWMGYHVLKIRETVNMNNQPCYQKTIKFYFTKRCFCFMWVLALPYGCDDDEDFCRESLVLPLNG